MAFSICRSQEDGSGRANNEAQYRKLSIALDPLPSEACDRRQHVAESWGLRSCSEHRRDFGFGRFAPDQARKCEAFLLFLDQ
jgi:hypothetical protein